MNELKNFVSRLIQNNFKKPHGRWSGLFEDSIQEGENHHLFLFKVDGKKKLVLIEKQTKEYFSELIHDEVFVEGGKKVFIASLNHANAELIRTLHPFTKPVAFGKDAFSLGLGDRLGLASPGHLRTIKGEKIRPVLAQQSMRELNLTERTYKDVLDAASWAVLQEGWHDGFGADGDHLKKAEDIKMALDIGYSMITLDCSERIDNSIEKMSDEEVALRYASLPKQITSELEGRYLNKSFSIGEHTVSFDQISFQKIVLTYGDALHFAAEIYTTLIQPQNRQIDFELSIDETAAPTVPAAHYLIASELTRVGVDLVSVAPRFCGEFQKAIDYIGDIAQFEEEFAIHAAIADKFGYRLSIHSGSDKFAVFPIIGQYTKGRVHVKTAGTNWLEALRVICRRDPAFFREICEFSLKMFPEATKFYHVTTDLKKVPSITSLPDAELERMLNEPDARQMLHITYGYILTDKNEKGDYRFRDKLYELWNIYEDDYANVLINHIGRHVELLISKMH